MIQCQGLKPRPHGCVLTPAGQHNSFPISNFNSLYLYSRLIFRDPQYLSRKILTPSFTYLLFKSLEAFWIHILFSRVYTKLKAKAGKLQACTWFPFFNLKKKYSVENLEMQENLKYDFISLKVIITFVIRRMRFSTYIFCSFEGLKYIC